LAQFGVCEEQFLSWKCSNLPILVQIGLDKMISQDDDCKIRLSLHHIETDHAPVFVASKLNDELISIFSGNSFFGLHLK